MTINCRTATACEKAIGRAAAFRLLRIEADSLRDRASAAQDSFTACQRANTVLLPELERARAGEAQTRARLWPRFGFGLIAGAGVMLAFEVFGDDPRVSKAAGAAGLVLIGATMVIWSW